MPLKTDHLSVAAIAIVPRCSATQIGCIAEFCVLRAASLQRRQLRRQLLAEASIMSTNPKADPQSLLLQLRQGQVITLRLDGRLRFWRR